LPTNFKIIRRIPIGERIGYALPFDNQHCWILANGKHK